MSQLLDIALGNIAGLLEVGTSSNAITTSPNGTST